MPKKPKKNPVEQVIGYVGSPIKARLRKLKEADRRLSESRVVEEALARFLPEIEQRLGIRQSRTPKLPT